ncbi:hypothetical protein ABQG71_21120 [Bacillus altitudinis]|uniref:Phosphatase n=1 Tax=Bacillus altitudinis TaxID=293387 RepID=A0ABV1SBL6_BACAB
MNFVKRLALGLICTSTLVIGAILVQPTMYDHVAGQAKLDSRVMI